MMFDRLEPRLQAPEASSVLRRARERMDVARGARILWVDDRPESVAHETAMLEGLGARVLHARSTQEAAKLLGGGRVDLILSDIARGGDPQAGVKGLQALRAAGRAVPVIFYVRDVEESKGVPKGAFGITDDPEELLHLVFDVLERG